MIGKVTGLGVVVFSICLLLNSSSATAAPTHVKRVYKNSDFGFSVKPVRGLKLCFDRDNVSIHGINLVFTGSTCAGAQGESHFSVSGYWNSQTYRNASEEAVADCRGQTIFSGEKSFGGLKIVVCKMLDKNSVDFELFAFRILVKNSPLKSINYRISAYCGSSEEQNCLVYAYEIARRIDLFSIN